MLGPLTIFAEPSSEAEDADCNIDSNDGEGGITDGLMNLVTPTVLETSYVSIS